MGLLGIARVSPDLRPVRPRARPPALDLAGYGGRGRRVARLQGPRSGMRTAAIHHALRRPPAELAVPRSLLHGSLDRPHCPLHAEPARANTGFRQRPLVAERAVHLRLLSAGAGGGAGDGVRLDAARPPRHLRRRRRAAWFYIAIWTVVPT